MPAKKPQDHDLKPSTSTKRPKAYFLSLKSKVKPHQRKGGYIAIDGHSLRLDEVEEISKGSKRVVLSEKALKQLSASRKVVEKALFSSQLVYGVNTGFGKFKDKHINPQDAAKLQHNLLVSHAAGVGPCFDKAVVRAIMLLRANALAKGLSGIRPEVVQLLLDCLNEGIHPLIPEQGSVGASGDLCPLAHLSLVLIGKGKAEYKDQIVPGKQALKNARLKPMTLAAKEGLALTNGTQVMSALSTLVLLHAERLAKVCDITGAMSLEAQLGTVRAFAKEIHQARPHPGQIASAQNIRTLLYGSELIESHRDCAMVQDAYSIRCMPQVHGASRQAFTHARQVIEIEVNSATDNPLVFPHGITSGGNFHGQPLALILDYMSIALAELANISERRIERLVNPALSNGLPPFLTVHGGLNSGLMVAQYTAAALVSENKCLAHPASVDSIPTSANQEDHVSMGPIAGRKARLILHNLERVLAIELLCATQGLDFRTRCYPDTSHSGKSSSNQLKPGDGLLAAYRLVRNHIPHLDEDREIHLDIAKAQELITSGELVQTVEKAVGPLL